MVCVVLRWFNPRKSRRVLETYSRIVRLCLSISRRVPLWYNLAVVNVGSYVLLPFFRGWPCSCELELSIDDPTNWWLFMVVSNTQSMFIAIYLSGLWPGRAWIVAFVYSFLGCPSICGKQSQLCPSRCSFEANISRMACCHACSVRPGVQLVVAINMHVGRVPMSIVERIFVPLHRLGQHESEIHFDGWMNRNRCFNGWPELVENGSLDCLTGN